MPSKKPTKSTKKQTFSSRRRVREVLFESDSTYFLKLVIYVLLGTFWIKFASPTSWLGISITALPVGLLLGVLAVRYFEKHQSDRKIWYAVLLVITVICYFVPAGLVV